MDPLGKGTSYKALKQTKVFHIQETASLGKTLNKKFNVMS
jgi:hypothetical protein